MATQTYEIPLSDTDEYRVASIDVPFDLTADEAERLSAIIRALAHGSVSMSVGRD